MLLPKMYIESAANGHLMLSWPSLGLCSTPCFAGTFGFAMGSDERAAWCTRPDDIILPKSVSPGMHLLAGWDNWSGYYLLSEDDAGDAFLNRLVSACSTRGERKH